MKQGNLVCLLVAALSLAVCRAVPISGSFQGTGTFSGATDSDGWACDGHQKPAAGLPTVALNGVQFARGTTCGACIQVTSTSGPLTGTHKVTVGNIMTQGSQGDLDFAHDGQGQHDIKWSFVKCPEGSSSSRKLLSA